MADEWRDDIEEYEIFNGGDESSEASKLLEMSPTNRQVTPYQIPRLISLRLIYSSLVSSTLLQYEKRSKGDEYKGEWDWIIDDICLSVEQSQLTCVGVPENSRVQYMNVVRDGSLISSGVATPQQIEQQQKRGLLSRLFK
jgi:hypothetical protein